MAVKGGADASVSGCHVSFAIAVEICSWEAAGVPRGHARRSSPGRRAFACTHAPWFLVCWLACLECSLLAQASVSNIQERRDNMLHAFETFVEKLGLPYGTTVADASMLLLTNG